jgi:threonine aldolase
MTSKQDSAAKRARVMSSPDSVVFSGDGDPQTPRTIIERLGAMLEANELRPDTYSLGGNVDEFERHMAEELGKEAAIWMPTGTLANHLALRRHSGMNARVVLQEQSHIYQDEGDALARLSGLNAVPLADGGAYFTADDLQKAIDLSVTGRVLNPIGAVSIESPVRRRAGQMMPYAEMESMTKLCREAGIPSHLDGARLYMMSAATGIAVKKYTELFDSVYVSTWKYFGSPFGAILAGPQEFIEGMYHDRRMFGGGLPSAYLATALSMNGKDGFVGKFSEALAKAKALFALIDELPGVKIGQFENGSNVFELQLDSSLSTDRFIDSLLDSGISIPWPTAEWHIPLMHVNSSMLRQSNDELLEAFSTASKVSKS